MKFKIRLELEIRFRRIILLHFFHCCIQMSWRDLDLWRILWHLDLFKHISIQYETSGMVQGLSSLQEDHKDFDQSYALLLIKNNFLDQQIYLVFSNL